MDCCMKGFYPVTDSYHHQTKTKFKRIAEQTNQTCELYCSFQFLLINCKPIAFCTRYPGALSVAGQHHSSTYSSFSTLPVSLWGRSSNSLPHPCMRGLPGPCFPPQPEPKAPHFLNQLSQSPSCGYVIFGILLLLFQLYFLINFTGKRV